MRWVAEAFWLVAAVIAFGAYAPSVAIDGALPVLPLIVVVRAGLTGGQLAGNILGFSGGLMMDVYSLPWFGSTMLIDSVIGAIVGAMRNRLMVDSPIARVLVLFAAATAHAIGLMFVREFVGSTIPVDPWIAAGTGLYTAAVGAVWWTSTAVARGVLGMRSVWDVDRE